MARLWPPTRGSMPPVLATVEDAGREVAHGATGMSAAGGRG